jgi:anti-anti-sigma regulatory factor
MTDANEHREGPVLVIRGPVDDAGVGDLERGIDAAGASGQRTLAIELDGVVSIDNQSLVRLCAVLQDALRDGITLTVAGAQARIGSVLHACGIPIVEPVGAPEVAYGHALTETRSEPRWRLAGPDGSVPDASSTPKTPMAG